MPDTHSTDLVELLSYYQGIMPFASALGVELVSAEQGCVTLEAPLIPAMEGPKGFFAASSVGALGDMAAMLSVTSMLPEGHGMSTMDFTVKMLGTANCTRLRAVGQAKQVGKTTCVGAAEIFIRQGDNWTPCGTLLATGRRMTLG